MDGNELGKKIREARLAKKLTQSETVGNFITRNMLSQIESGNATPSLKTLEYLCERLELPFDQLVAKDSECKPPANPLIEAKNNIKNHQYKKVLKLSKLLTDTTNDYYDEYCALYTLANISLAKENAKKGNHSDAIPYAKTASEYSEKGIYKNSTLHLEAMLLLQEEAKAILEK
ncbi:MAG: helix-turn-helix domain-containing protein [Lachnospiraceae bacterium]|nr:helix-turn-helix domain-containing protein [Lachnospiraceae bacterium]